MFKKFTCDGDLNSTNKLKNSATRAILSQIIEQYPHLEEAIEQILPKNALMLAKGLDMQMLLVNGEVTFIQPADCPWFPTLRLLHKYPGIMKRMQVDRGAIRFVLGGANIMCPGFTSPGGSIPMVMEEGEPVGT